MAGDVEAFIERWQGHEGGQERANYALFLSELCDALDLPRPDPADAAHETNDYVFERLVHRHDGGDAAGWGRIDLYKRGCFILEAKQSRWKGGKKAIAGQDDLFQAQKERARGRRSIDRNWDVLMLNARRQAEEYPVTTVVDGEEIYPNPRKPDWPMAEFIVGNPPFIGGGFIRSRMGDGYTETLWAAHKKVNNSADFVMYWWDRAAELLTAKGTVLRRFGLVTTNSITQVFQRKTVERHLMAQKPISLLMAIPDHPWTKASRDAAAVRIAMTVATAGLQEGVLREVTRETDLATDEPVIELKDRAGKINTDLTVGANVTDATALLANRALSSPGVKLHGAGFIVPRSVWQTLRASDADDVVLKRYRNAKDLTARPRDVFVIDFFGLEREEARQRHPDAFQHVMLTVKPDRDTNRRDYRRENWWLFGENNPDLRRALAGLNRFIATGETMKHRTFQFLSTDILPDNMVTAVASNDAFHLAVLSSRLHVTWALAAGGWLGVGNDPRYSKSRTFDPFPFPDPVPETLKQELREAAEELDRTRKEVLDAHDDLTLTKLYNVLEKGRAIAAAERGAAPSTAQSAVPLPRDAGEDAPTDAPALTDAEIDMRDRGRVLILKDLHDVIDRLTFKAYGWPETLTDADILERLVALNKERAAEEAKGQVRWLRPEYQIPRFGQPAERRQQIEATLTAPEDAGKPSFPREEARRAMVISAALARATGPISAAEIARQFRQGKGAEKEIALMLRAFARLGELSSTDGGKTFMLRRAA